MFRCAIRPTRGFIQQHTTAVATVINCQQKRHEVIMRRMYPPRLYKKDIAKALKKREFTYIMEENTNDAPLGNMEVILAIDIEELGYRGDVITLPKNIARNYLLPVGAAVYPTPENSQLAQQWQDEDPNKVRRTKSAEKTVRQLSAMTLPISMSPNNSWTINKRHVRVALRRHGVQASEDCITLPKRDITEPGAFEFTLTVNQVDKVKIHAVIEHHYPDQEPEKIAVFMKTKRKLTDIIAEAVEKNNLSEGLSTS